MSQKDEKAFELLLAKADRIVEKLSGKTSAIPLSEVWTHDAINVGKVTDDKFRVDKPGRKTQIRFFDIGNKIVALVEGQKPTFIYYDNVVMAKPLADDFSVDDEEALTVAEEIRKAKENV